MRRFVAAFFFLIPLISFSQVSNLRVKNISLVPDSIVLDSVSMVPGSAYIVCSGEVINTSLYEIDYLKSVLKWHDIPDVNRRDAMHCVTVTGDSVSTSFDSVTIYYRVFPFSFFQSIKHKDINRISAQSTGPPKYIYNPNEEKPSFFKYEGLNKSGSISRGVTFGNNQDIFVNSSLNLQLAGKLNNDVNILAAITDENIPIQPEGNTQQLQDFDKVFIQIYNEKSKLIAGDFELKRPDSYFMNFFKKGQGALFSTSFHPPVGNKNAVNRLTVSGAVSKGKFARNTLVAVEGNQGPYRLTGTNNETFIIVLAGTEKVYSDGMLMKRGLQYDYTIDYNTAEVVFTAKRLVTKDSRIVVEFEYSEKSYARSLLFFGDEYETEKLKIKFNAYSEQDSKNQPLLIDLDSTRKTRMANVGDSIQNAVAPTEDSIAFNANEVLYKKIDTLGFSGVFVYSVDPDSAHFRVRFSNVGPGNGDYVQDIGGANGRVFKWIAPVGNVHLGSYSPVSLLITPKKQQMFTLGSDVKISKNNLAGIELGLSNNNINLFSDNDHGNDIGYASKAYYQNITSLDGDTLKGWKLVSNLNYEFVGRDFKALERFRNVEFERDWNLGNNTIYHDEQIGSGQLTLSKLNLGKMNYQLRSFQKGSDYNGLLHSGGVLANYSRFILNANGSLLNTKGIAGETEYYKHNGDFSKEIRKILIGVRENTEHNEFRDARTDSLTPLSFFFREYAGYLSTKDTLKNHASLNYKKRYDDGISGNQFIAATEADELNGTAEFIANQNNQIRLYSSYRKLRIIDSTLAVAASGGETKTFLNRIDHNVKLWKGVVNATTYYEVGTGQERKLEYYFLEVPTGQGAFIWNDYNNNGIKELNEFEPVQYHDQKEYLKIYTPTNQYISTRTNQFNEVLNINPAASHKSFQGSQPLITRFSNLLSVRLDKKTINENIFHSLNPFNQVIGDSSLVSTNSNYRNTLYFNRSSVNFGCDVTYGKAEGKSLLTNGYETRAFTSQESNIRWNLSRLLLLTIAYQRGDKENSSQFFPEKNYHILSDETEPKLSIQPSSTFRVTVAYKYSAKENVKEESGEKATADHLGVEMKYTTMSTGSFLAKVNYIGIKFNADENSSLAYDMLEGLRKGTNFTWNAAIQRSLGSSMQLSVNYDGRKSENTKTIHTGGVQFRAYF